MSISLSPSITPSPTIYDPTPSPTVRFWASEEGEAIASSSGAVVTLMFLIGLTWLSHRYISKRPGSIDDRDHSTTSSLNVSLIETDSPIAFNGDTQSNINKLKRNSILLQSPSTSSSTLIMFWILMSARTVFALIGVLGWWNFIWLDGESSEVSAHGNDEGVDDKLLADFKVIVFQASFYDIVKEFWYSKAHAMAMLTYFSGVIQPCLQTIACFVIAFAPTSVLGRHRMLTVQELTCKIPLSSVLIEAYLLISFSFSLKYNLEVDLPRGRSKTIVNDGDVIIKAYLGLFLYMFSNITFLIIVNVLRWEHRRQCKESLLDSEVDKSEVDNAQLVLFEDTEHENAIQETSWYKKRLIEDDNNNVVMGPFAERSAKLRVSIVVIGLFFLLSLAYILKFPYMEFRYRGIAAPYIYHLQGSHSFDNHTKLNFGLDLYEATTQLEPDLLPMSYAKTFTAAGLLLFLIDSLLLCFLCMVTACLPDKMLKARRQIGEFTELLQCWSGTEVLFIATMVMIPNMELITEFVFDNNSVCKEMDSYEGQECLVITCHFMDIPSAFALFTYFISAYTLINLNSYQLHGGYKAWSKLQVHSSGRAV